MDWTAITAAGALALGSLNLGLMAIDRNRRSKVAQRVDGLLQKFREAGDLVADVVRKLVTADAAKAAEIERLKAELADVQAELTSTQAELAKFDGSYIVTDADVDEMGDIAARLQSAATAASTRSGSE